MAEEKTSCVLRLFGAPQGQLAGAVGQFAPQWKTQAQWKSRGGETLLALQAASPSGLKKAAQSLQAQFEADLYGAGDTSLAAAVVNALERHDRLLVCSDAAARVAVDASGHAQLQRGRRRSPAGSTSGNSARGRKGL